MSLYGAASSMGVPEDELGQLLKGQASSIIAKKVGVSRMDLQRFIAGDVSMSMALAIGMLKSQAQELRDRAERDVAIGIIIGICAKRRESF